MRRPRIGIPLDLDAAGDYRLPHDYGDAVAAAGGLPMPLCHGDAAAAAECLAACDGVLVPGGVFDVPPERYGEARRPGCGASRPERTDFEWALVEAAFADGVPVLGVCGGMQLINVVRGGSLFQHLPDDVGVDHQQGSPKENPSHAVEVVAGTLLARLVGEQSLEVNSTHHQAVRRLGNGVRVSASAADGVIEALEIPGLPFALGVQWHPESMFRTSPRHLGPYRGLVAAARERVR